MLLLISIENIRKIFDLKPNNWKSCIIPAAIASTIAAATLLPPPPRPAQPVATESLPDMRAIAAAAGLPGSRAGSAEMVAALYGQNNAPGPRPFPLSFSGQSKVVAGIKEDGPDTALRRVASAFPVQIAPHTKLPLSVAVNCVARTIAGEARGETNAGEIGVANVVINRVKAWGAEYCATVYQEHRTGPDHYKRHEFDGAYTVASFSKEDQGRASAIAFAALRGRLRDVTGGALFFHKCRRGSERLPGFIRRIDHHCYFRNYPGLDAGRPIRHVVSSRDDGVKTASSEIAYHIVPDESSRYGYRISASVR